MFLDLSGWLNWLNQQLPGIFPKNSLKKAWIWHVFRRTDNQIKFIEGYLKSPMNLNPKLKSKNSKNVLTFGSIDLNGDWSWLANWGLERWRCLCGSEIFLRLLFGLRLNNWHWVQVRNIYHNVTTKIRTSESSLRFSLHLNWQRTESHLTVPILWKRVEMWESS